MIGPSERAANHFDHRTTERIRQRSTRALTRVSVFPVYRRSVPRRHQEPNKQDRVSDLTDLCRRRKVMNLNRKSFSGLARGCRLNGDGELYGLFAVNWAFLEYTFEVSDDALTFSVNH